MIDPIALRAWAFPVVTRDYDEDDAILYALGIGIGQDPVDPLQLRFVFEDGLQTLPTMAVVLGFPGPWLSDPATGIDYTRVVHGEQHLEILRPLPVRGTVRCVNRVAALVDKGAGKGAAVTVVREIHDAANGELLSRQTSILLARGDGGFGAGDAASGALTLAPVPDSTPDATFRWRVPPQSALIYRLSGDRNPLHADPARATRAGFERPILHGLASFGIAGFAAIAALCDGDPGRLCTIGVRFSAPVLPGDTLEIDFWHIATGDAAFRARAMERDRIVLANGHVRFAA